MKTSVSIVPWTLERSGNRSPLFLHFNRKLDLRHNYPPMEHENPSYIVSPGLIHWFIFMQCTSYAHLDVQQRAGWMSIEPSYSKTQMVEVPQDLLVRYQERLMTNISRSIQHLHISLFSLRVTQWLASLEGFCLPPPQMAHRSLQVPSFAPTQLFQPNHLCILFSNFQILFFTFLVDLIFQYMDLINFFLYMAALWRSGSLNSYWIMLAVADRSCPIPHLAMVPKGFSLWQCTSELSRRVPWWGGTATATQLLWRREGLQAISVILWL